MSSTKYYLYEFQMNANQYYMFISYHDQLFDNNSNHIRISGDDRTNDIYRIVSNTNLCANTYVGEFNSFVDCLSYIKEHPIIDEQLRFSNAMTILNRYYNIFQTRIMEDPNIDTIAGN